MNASEMRRSRASRRRRAAALIAQPSAVATTAAPSTSQKCACWFSQLTSTFGRASRIARSASGATTTASQTLGSGFSLTPYLGSNGVENLKPRSG